MSNLLGERGLTDSGGQILEPSSSKKQRFIDSTKILLDIAKESADILLPLKATLGTLSVLIKHYEERKDVRDKLEQLIQWSNMLKDVSVASAGGDPEEKRREQLMRSLENIKERSELLLRKMNTAWILDMARAHETAVKLAEELLQTVVIYQVGAVDDHPNEGPSQVELPSEKTIISDIFNHGNFFPTEYSTPDVGASSLPSFSGLGHSVEIPTVLASSDAMDPDGFAPSPNLPPPKLAEIEAECQTRPSQELIDELDAMLDHATCDQDWCRLLNILCKMCSRQRMIPGSMRVDKDMIGGLVEEDQGGSATIFRAQYKDRPVAVKTIRVHTSADFDKCHSEFCREVVVWRHLRHPNILPLFGVSLERHQLSMISEWMDQGNINEFIKGHGGVNRLQLLVDAAHGLEYMHNLNIVHGDLKGANILINRSYRACLADFGLSTISNVEQHVEDNASFVSAVSKSSLVSFVAGGTHRWMSPELFDPERFGASDDRPTKRSDCFALGMVVYEVLLGNSPYWDITNQGTLIYAIIEGYRPRKPDAAERLGFTNELWKMLQQCWLADANARLDVRAILSHLNLASWAWERRRLGDLPGLCH